MIQYGFKNVWDRKKSNISSIIYEIMKQRSKSQHLTPKTNGSIRIIELSLKYIIA